MELARSEDANAAKGTEYKQIFVSGDDHVSSTGDYALKDMDVFGIAANVDAQAGKNHVVPGPKQFKSFANLIITLPELAQQCFFDFGEETFRSH